MRIVLILLSILTTLCVHAQNVGIGTTTPNPSALLDLQSSSRGFLPPRVTTVQRDAITQPAAGLVIYNSDLNVLQMFDGSAWTTLSHSTTNWGAQSQNFSVPSAVSTEKQTVALNGQNGINLGHSLTSKGDFLAVGNPHNFKAGTNTPHVGSVYLYRKSGVDWSLSDVLSVEDATSANAFGKSLGFDGSTMIVGAPASNQKGRAYLYNVNAGGGASYAYSVQAYNGNTGDKFGEAVAVSGDYAIVGAPEYRNGTIFDHGTAYIYVRSGLTWVHQAQLLQPDGEDEDFFGSAVDISGNTAVVGAFFKDLQHGKVYVYGRSGTQWTLAQEITPPPSAGTTVLARFGQHVQISNDTLLIGAGEYSGSTSKEQTGHVYVYKKINGTYTLVHTITPVGKFYDEGFGTSFHMQGGHIIVGAPYAFVNGLSAQGKAYVFRKSGNIFVQEAVFASNPGNNTDYFGFRVRLTNSSAVVAAPWADFEGLKDNGKIYFFDR